MKNNRNYVLMINGQLIRNNKDLPYRCSKEVAKANVKANPRMKMLKIDVDIKLGKE